MTKWANYTAPNLGLLFYKRIYSENKSLANFEGGEMIFKVNKEHSQFSPYYDDFYNFQLNDYSLAKVSVGNQRFTLFTTYPGLIAGVGYIHGSKTTGDAAIGFYFDHTTGLPTIPSSSVKGVLRSLFEVDSNGKKEFTGEKSVAAIRFIIDEYEAEQKNTELFKEFKQQLDADKLNQLKKEIFGDQDEDGTDVFYDAIIDLKETNVNQFLSDDYITPHQPNFLKNPTPTQFLKVLPNVGFQFRFDLKDGKILTAQQKEALYKQILLTIGIGAKTNVGYGQFTNNIGKYGNTGDKIKNNPPTNTIENSNINDKIILPTDADIIIINKNNGGKFEGEIVFNKKDNFIIQLSISPERLIQLKKKADKFKGGTPQIGKKVIVTFTTPYDKNNPGFSATLKEE